MPHSTARRYDPDAGDQPSAADPWNTLLDQYEAQTRLLLENGLEPQIRARLARLLPGSVDQRSAPPAPASEPGRLELSAALTVCRQIQRMRLTQDQHAAVGTLRAWLLEQISGRAAR